MSTDLSSRMTAKKREIEEMRRKLHHMVEQKAGHLRHEEVAKLSVELDYLIVDYERLKAEQLKACRK